MAQAEARLKLPQGLYQDHDLVFAGPTGMPTARCSVRTGFRRICQKAGNRPGMLRELRHSFVSIVSESGADIEAIADAVGARELDDHEEGLQESRSRTRCRRQPARGTTSRNKRRRPRRTLR